MNGDESFTLIAQGRMNEWNQFRGVNPEFEPDFSHRDFTTVPLDVLFPILWRRTFFPSRLLLEGQEQFRQLGDLKLLAILGVLCGAEELARVYKHRPSQWDFARANFCGALLPPADCGRLIPLACDADEPQFRMISFLTNFVFLSKHDEFYNELRVEVMSAPVCRNSYYDVNTKGGTLAFLRECGAGLRTELGLNATPSHVLVFISYAWADDECEVVLAIDKFLRVRGIETRMDKRDFFAGQRIRDEIMRVMSVCSVIIIFFSRVAKNRCWTEFERELAEDYVMEAKLNKKKPPKIIYVCIDDTELPSVSVRQRIVIRAPGRGFSVVCDELYRHILGLPGRHGDNINLDDWSDFEFPNGQ